MNKKDKEVPEDSLWGSTETEPRESMRKRADARISKLPEKRKKILYASLIALVVILFVGLVSCGAVLASNQTEQADPGKAVLDLTETDKNEDALSKSQNLSARFVDADYLDFLSKESLNKFMDEFISHIDTLGYDKSTTVKVWSNVTHNETQYSYYVSTSSDGQFFHVTFDVQSKEFSIEKSDAPADLPELQNGGEAAARAAAEQEDAQKSEPAPEETPSIPQETTPEETPVVTPAPPIQTCKLTDTAELSTLLPEKALKYLPDAVVGYMQSKGYTVTPDSCTVNLSSATVSNSSPYFEIACTSTSGTTTTISCEWNAQANQFGMAVIG